MSVSFLIWIILMAGMVSGYFAMAKRGRHIESRTEDVASQALPEIGKIAERQHTLRFGRPPTNTPGPPGESVWYPPLGSKKKGHRHA